MANENPTWGYTRIRGGLKQLGHDVARNSIKAILKDHGIEPALGRRTKMPWKTFLAAHWDGLAAADFFTVDVVTVAGTRVRRSLSRGTTAPGFEQRLIAPRSTSLGPGRVRCRERLGGVLKFYYARPRNRVGRVFAQDGVTSRAASARQRTQQTSRISSPTASPRNTPQPAGSPQWDLAGGSPSATVPFLRLHDLSAGFPFAHRTLATLALGRARFGRRHPAASAFLHCEFSLRG